MFKDKFLELLKSARAQSSRSTSIAYLEQAVRHCRMWADTENTVEPYLFEAQACAALAIEQNDQIKRRKTWQTALALLQRQAFTDSDFARNRASTFASLAVDCFHDTFGSLELDQRVKLLRQALAYLNKAIPGAEDGEFGKLLVRKSSILRQLANLERMREPKLGHIRESRRCLDLALSKDVEDDTYLELANAEWALAAFADSDQEYADQLRKVEQILTSENLSESEIAKFAYAEFLRSTYRPLDACVAYPKAVGPQGDFRRLLRDSFVYAEAALQLWFVDTPEKIAKPHLRDAKTLVEMGIAAGYNNARMIVDLAYLSAVIDGVPQGEMILRDICSTDRGVDWSAVIRLASAESPADLVTQGFVLGMDQSAVWSRLGTFARRFMNDDDLAEVLYRAAIRINPHDAIALTNLARHIVRQDDSCHFAEAERFLLRAQNFASRRFVWWRTVLAELEQKRGVDRKTESSPRRAENEHRIPNLSNIRDVRKQFRILSNFSNPQLRGYGLEKLVFALAKLTFGLAMPPYTISGDGGILRQIDGFFLHGTEKYRVECKWVSEPISQNEIVIFADKLEVAGVSGLFISMSGFTETAVIKTKHFRETKPILLMDGTEARAAFEGLVRFDDMIARKRLRLDQFSDPYYRIVGPYLCVEANADEVTDL